MNKLEFMRRLREALSGLPQEELAERLTFYDEMIADRMEDGLSEEAAVAEIGAVDEIAAQAVADIPLGEQKEARRRFQPWEIVLLILGFPLWFPLLITAFVLLFSAHLVLWALVVSLWALELSLVVSVPCAMAAGFLSLFRGELPQGLLMLSAGLTLAGLAIFLFFGCRAASRGAVVLAKKTVCWVKSLFLRKENAV